MKFKGLTVSALLLTGTVAMASENTISIEIASNDYNEDSVSAEPQSFAIKLEHWFNDQLAIGIKYGRGMGEDSVIIVSRNVDVSVEDYYGLHAKYQWLPKETFQPYAYVGYTNSEFTAEGSHLKYTQSENGLSYGLGLNVDVDDAIDLYADFGRLIDKNNVEVKQFNVGVSYHF